MNELQWSAFLERCFIPRVFYDIGANNPFATPGGQQVAFKPLLPGTEFYLFEASAKHEPELLRSGEPYAIAVLGELDGDERTFYESTAYPSGTGDSLYREQSRFYADDVLVQKCVTTRTLDSVVAERGWPFPDFIKLDTQGSELAILRGAPNCLARARAVMLECSVREYNRNAPRLADIVFFMGNEGFEVWDINAPEIGRAHV